jgi:glutamine synthetase
MTPDAFLAEYGARQYEVTVAPAHGMRAADEAVMLREIARSVASQAGHRAIFSPMLEPDGVGNGTHIHFSLRDPAGAPTMYDGQRPYGLTRGGEYFVAGILEHMPALAAITTPSVASYYRLTPNRWAPTWANVAVADRAASLRVCPGSESSFNVEYRVADATACPYLALGALVNAGVDGIERKLKLPPPGEKHFSQMDDEERGAMGTKALPTTLAEALELLRKTPAAGEWFGHEFLGVYLGFKQDEVDAMAGLDPETVCDRYAAVY